MAVRDCAVVDDVRLDMTQYVDDKGSCVTQPFIFWVLLRQANIAAWVLVMPSSVVLDVRKLYLQMYQAVTHVLQVLEDQVTKADVPDQATVVMSGVQQFAESDV